MTTGPTLHRDELEGYAPIEDYAVLGNGRTVALISAAGSVDWFPIPTHDATPVLGALLDRRRGGAFELSPRDDGDAKRRYLPGTNVLETTFTTSSGVVTVTDVLTLHDGVAVPWTELVRCVRARSGRVPMRWRFWPRREWGERPFEFEPVSGGAIANGDSPQLALLSFDAGEPSFGGDLRGEFVADAETVRMLVVVGVDDEPLPIPDRDEVVERVDSTIDTWERWSRGITCDGPRAGAVLRSALCLKTLIHSPTGAILAAPTTSLPERIGGALNWDYRYSWLRDSSYTLDALLSVDLVEEAHSSLSWLLRTIRADAPQFRPFYNIDGTRPAPGGVLESVAGYRDSRPVRSGNGAARQLQLGNFGDVFDTVYRYVRAGNHLDGKTATMLGATADHVCDAWKEPDNGIWELRGRRLHYTESKMGCWSALDRAVLLADAGEIDGARRDVWSSARTDIADYVESETFSTRHGCYMMATGDTRMDAAVLRAVRMRYGHTEHLRSTVDTIAAALSAGGPLLYRYSGQDENEGAFVACSFWLVEARAGLGQIDEAERLFEAMAAYANDVGLFAEEIDPGTGHQLGNFPQGLSHLALMNAAASIAKARSASRPG